MLGEELFNLVDQFAGVGAEIASNLKAAPISQVQAVAPEEADNNKPQTQQRHQANESVIPDGPASYDVSERQVFLCCRQVGAVHRHEALAILNQMATDVYAAKFNLSGVPNPTYHWAITVGDYLHQLQATSMLGGWNYYTNVVNDGVSGGWQSFPVGTTTLNDVAIRDVATEAMNETPEVYDVFSNNCQMYALRLADKVLKTARAQKYLMANMTYGIQKAPELDISLVPRPMLMREDTGEEVDPAELNPPTEPAATEPAPVAQEQAPVAEEQPLVVEVVPEHGEPVVIAEEEDQARIRSEMLANVARLMIDNTPTLKPEEIVNPTATVN